MELHGKKKESEQFVNVMVASLTILLWWDCKSEGKRMNVARLAKQNQ
jgi:hypothetical protein